MSEKAVTMEQLLESARRGEALAMQVAQAAQAELEGKQDKIAGVAFVYDAATKTLTIEGAT